MSNAEDFAKVASATSLGFDESKTRSIVARGTSANLFVDFMDEDSRIGSSISYYVNDYKFGVINRTYSWRADYLDKLIVLGEDIDLSGKLWTPIGVGLDGYDIKPNTVYKSSINKGIINTFKGSIDGNGKTILNATVIETNKNVGIFGTIEVESGRYTGGAFATRLLIKDSNFVSVSENDGVAVAGSLVGRAILNYGNIEINSIPKLILQVGTEDANVYSSNIASGLVGQIVNEKTSDINPMLENRVLNVVIQYAYVNSNVVSQDNNNNFTSAFVHMGNNVTYEDSGANIKITKTNKNRKTIKELYVAGDLGVYIKDGNNYKFVRQSQAEEDYVNRTALFGNLVTTTENVESYNSLLNSIYALEFTDGSYYTKVNDETLKTAALNHFSWGNQWDRLDGVNENYPVLNSAVSYWVLNQQEVVPDANGVYVVSTPQELAWIADQVNTGVNTFGGKTVKLNADLDLAKHIWSPIGYSGDRSFQGTFDFNGKTILNIMTSGTYVIDGDSIICKDHKNVGLFGYTHGGEITSSTGVGTLNITDGSNSLIVSTGNVGALIGFAEDTKVSNIVNKITVTSTRDEEFSETSTGAGGLVGAYHATKDIEITNVENYGYVNVSRNNAGGIIGYTSGTSGTLTLTKTRNTGNINSSSDNVGGLIGCSSGKLYINGIGNWGEGSSNTYASDEGKSSNTTTTPDNEGYIKGANSVGGIVGSAVVINIECVTNAGKVEAVASNAGGIVGYMSNASSNKSIYEVINIGEISAYTYAGGIAGYVGNSDTIKIANMLNKGSVSETTGSGKLIGGGTEGGLGLKIYSGVDTSTNDTSKKLIAIGFIDEKTEEQVYKNHGIMNLGLAATVLSSNTEIVYSESNIITFKSVFDESLVWSGVKGGMTESTVKLDYRKQPNEADKPNEGTYLDDVETINVYKIEKTENLKYLNDLNRKRYGVSSLKEKYSVLFAKDIVDNESTSEDESMNNVVNLGYGAYPWRSNIYGDNHTLEISSFDSTSKTKSLFGAVFGLNSEKVKVNNIKLKYGSSISPDNSGLYMAVGTYTDIENLDVLSNYGGIITSSNFGTVAQALNYSTISDCDVDVDILSTGNNVNVGGLVGEIYNTTVEDCVVNATITSQNASVTGGVIGKAESDGSNNNIKNSKYCVINLGSNEENSKQPNKQIIADLGIAGGIVGKSSAYNYENCIAGYIYQDENGVFLARMGLVDAPTCGGIIGDSTRDILNLCSSSLDVGSFENDYAGGIVGKNNTRVNIKESESSSLVKGKNAGGIIGVSESATIEACTNSKLGEVICRETAGGFVAKATDTEITACAHEGYVASEEFSINHVVGGAIGNTSRSNSNLYKVSNCTMEGYVGVWAGSKSNTSYGYPINDYYSIINIDGKDGLIDGSYTTGSVSDNYDSSKSSVTGDFNYGMLIGYANTTEGVNNSTTIETGDEYSFTVYDYYVTVGTSTNGKISWWKRGYLDAKLYERSGTAGEFGSFALGDASCVASDRDTCKGGMFGGLDWGKLSVTLSYATEQNQTFPANSNAKTYYIKYETETISGITTGVVINRRKHYENYEIHKPIASFVSNSTGIEVMYVISGWSKTKGGSDIPDGTAVNETNFTFTKSGDDNVTTVYAIWEKDKINIALYGKNGVYPDFTTEDEEACQQSFTNSSIGSFLMDMGSAINTTNLSVYKQYPTFKDNLNRPGYIIDAWYGMTKDEWDQLVELANDTAILEEKKEARDDARERLNLYMKANSNGSLDWEAADDSAASYEYCKVTNKVLYNQNSSIYAHWVEVKTVKFYYNDGLGTEKEVIVKKGEKVEKIYPSKNHYVFLDWYIAESNGGTITSTGTKFDFDAAVTKDYILIAEWEPEKYDVTFKYVVGETNKQTKVEDVEYNTLIPTAKVPNADQRTGYTFKRWTYVDGSTGQPATFDLTTKRIESNITLTAEYEIKYYDVKFYAKETDTTTLSVSRDKNYIQSVQYKGKAVDVLDPGVTGYDFEGWLYRDSSGTEKEFKTGTSGTEIITDTKVYAKLKPQQFDVTYIDAETSDEISTLYGTAEYNSHPQVPTDISKDGYRLEGYYSNSICTSAFNHATYVVTGNTTVYVNFVKQYTVTFVVEGHYNKASTEIVKEVKVDEGATINSGDIPSDTTFMASDVTLNSSGWKLYDESIADDYTDLSSYSITKNVEFHYYADVTVTFMDNVDTLDSSQFKTYRTIKNEYNTALLGVAEPTYSGYGFDGYFKDKSFSTPFDSGTKLTTATTIYIKFSPERTVTLRVNNMPTEIKVVNGRKIQTTENADGSLTITGTAITFDTNQKDWYLDGSVIDITTYIVNSDITLELGLKKLTITLHYYNSNAEISSSTETVDYGYLLTRPTETVVETETVKYSIVEYYTSTSFDSGNVFPFGTGVQITANTDIYVDVTVSEVMIAYVYNDGSNWVKLDGFGGFVTYNSTLTKPETDPTLEGYAFGGYYTDSALETEFVFGSYVQESVTIYVNFVEGVTVKLYNDSGTLKKTVVIKKGGTLPSAVLNEVSQDVALSGSERIVWYEADDVGEYTETEFDKYAAINSDINLRYYIAA